MSFYIWTDYPCEGYSYEQADTLDEAIKTALRGMRKSKSRDQAEESLRRYGEVFIDNNEVLITPAPISQSVIDLLKEVVTESIQYARAIKNETDMNSEGAIDEWIQRLKEAHGVLFGSKQISSQKEKS